MNVTQQLKQVLLQKHQFPRRNLLDVIQSWSGPAFPLYEWRPECRLGRVFINLSARCFVLDVIVVCHVMWTKMIINQEHEESFVSGAYATFTVPLPGHFLRHSFLYSQKRKYHCLKADEKFVKMKTFPFQWLNQFSNCPDNAGLNLGFHPGNERRRYKVKPSLIGWSSN